MIVEVSVMRKEFKFNFMGSFIIYVVVNIIGILSIIPLASVGYLGGVTRILAFMWFSIVPVVLYFSLSSKLKPLGNHLLNYASVSSSFIFAIIVTTYDIALYGNVIQPSDVVWGGMINLSFGLWTVLVAEILGRWVFYILAILPSLIMWLRLTEKVTGFGSKFVAKVRRVFKKIDTIFPDELRDD